MKYEYNGNLLEDDRINLVANEIVNVYPQIGFDKAKEAAMLEGKISTNKDFEMEFNRLYNIMLVTNNNKQLTAAIYNDLVSLLNNNKTDEKFNYYCNIVLKIYDFLNGKEEFPFLEEF